MTYRRGLALVACVALLVGCAPNIEVITLEACSTRTVFQNERTTGAVPLRLRIDNLTGASFVATATCISVDGQAVRQEAPAALSDGFAKHAPLLVETSLRPGVSHHVEIVVELAGHGAAQGYKFIVHADHDVVASRLGPTTLVAELYEGGDASTPIERRPTVRWTEQPPGPSS
jgi:hypothetical protein